MTRVSQAVVVIKTTGTRAFDTESAGSSYATGFVVDKRLGIILTNRHVLRPGPVVAEAVFQNREEVPLRALYCDPVHDFAFFRFDPSAVAFHRVEEVPLAPDAASVGLEVRVVGNDSGEKLSILSATLARLDRDAPKYGSTAYNDFNTFYLQAASGTKGGSSGSPVVDVHGRAVALNAGSKTKGSSAYYLPLHRVERALGLLRAACPVGADGVPTPGVPTWNEPDVPRGTLQTTFAYKGFDECRRLGLRRETEAELRASQGEGGTGALVVEDTVPGGPGEGILQVGDVLVSVTVAEEDGDEGDDRGRGSEERSKKTTKRRRKTKNADPPPTTDFVALESILDANVGGTLVCRVERGGTRVEARVVAGDLHAVTPRRMLEVCGGSVHALSYQQARNFQLPVGSVYVAEPGYVLGLGGVPKHAIVTALGNEPTPDLDAFARAFAKIPEGSKAPLRYLTHDERHRVKTAAVRMQTRWYPPPAFLERDWRTGVWARTPVEAETVVETETAVEAETAVETLMAVETSPRGSGSPSPSARPETPSSPAPPDANNTSAEAVAVRLEASLALVQCDIATVALADGVYSRSFEGNGTVVHHDPDGTGLGLIVVDRNTVPIASCDVTINFASYPHETTGEVAFLHPTHNFALVSYDAREMARTHPEAAAATRAATLAADAAPLKRGDEVVLVGLTSGLRAMSRVSVVTDATSSAGIPSADIPRFRAVNEETIQVDVDFGYSFGGVLADFRGRVAALWGSYAKPDGGEVRDVVRGMAVAPVATATARLIARREDAAAGRKLATRHVRVPTLDAEFEPVTLAKAEALGVPREWIAKLLAADPARRQALTVASTVAATGAAETLRGGDIVLAVDGEPATSFRAVERAVERAVAAAERDAKRGEEANGDENGDEDGRRDRNTPRVSLTALRSGEVVDAEVRLSEVSCAGTERLLHWAGAQLQPTHRPVAELGFRPVADDGSGRPLDVFVSRWYHGSPAQRYGLYALNWVASVNDQPTPTLDDFLRAVGALEDGSHARLKLVSLQGRPKVLTIKLDTHYWPTWELRRAKDGSDEWERVLF